MTKKSDDCKGCVDYDNVQCNTFCIYYNRKNKGCFIKNCVCQKCLVKGMCTIACDDHMLQRRLVRRKLNM
jgi:hypothetical protein